MAGPSATDRRPHPARCRFRRMARPLMARTATGPRRMGTGRPVFCWRARSGVGLRRPLGPTGHGRSVSQPSHRRHHQHAAHRTGRRQPEPSHGTGAGVLRLLRLVARVTARPARTTRPLADRPRDHDFPALSPRTHLGHPISSRLWPDPAHGRPRHRPAIQRYSGQGICRNVRGIAGGHPDRVPQPRRRSAPVLFSRPDATRCRRTMRLFPVSF